MVGEEKLHIRGATYGTFAPGDGSFLPEPEVVATDFAQMAAAGLNAVRTYTVPSRAVLDLAEENGLRVLVGLPWEQHVTFLDAPKTRRGIVEAVSAGVRACAGHPAVLGYAIGNEIPAGIVRWHGQRRIERFLERLYGAVKEQDPESLVTYVNFPSTEYLELPFLDFVSFNVFLEDGDRFEAYLARLQHIAGDRPLLVTELGLDSRRNGLEAQAQTLRSQIEDAFATGATGVFVFSWTDEWHRGGAAIDDWDFGVVDRDRRPKPALVAIGEAFAAVPFSPRTPSRRAIERNGARDSDWPRISVVVCTHNGRRTLPQCLEELTSLDYPDYEVIVVSDGSTDGSDQIAVDHGCIAVRTEHKGLSAARNAGIERSSGEIVAFLDDDAYPDPDWLHYLAASFARSSHGAIGGPNLLPPDDGPIARSVAASPGSPVHVMIGDRLAEHIPGCNMAFRREALEEIGGFDEVFRVAGDDVDICWRVQDAGYSVGFNAGAVVMHRRRDSIRRYLKQQYGYGKAEALLERKWPRRHNWAGHPSWAGRIYGGSRGPQLRAPRVHYGTWGSGMFQSVYEPAPSFWTSLPLMPEWYLVIGALTLTSVLGLVWAPLFGALPLLVIAIGLLLFRGIGSGWHAHPIEPGETRSARLSLRVTTSFLFVAQPLARLLGRLRLGLAPWRRRGTSGWVFPRSRVTAIWSEQWEAPESRLLRLEEELAESGAVVTRGHAFGRWDLEARAGPLGTVRLRAVVEEHGAGRQMERVRSWPRPSPAGAITAVVLWALTVAAWVDEAYVITFLLAVFAAVTSVAIARDCGTANRLTLGAIAKYGSVTSETDPVPDAQDRRQRFAAQARAFLGREASNGLEDEQLDGPTTGEDARGSKVAP